MLFKRNEVWITRAAPSLLLICTAVRRWRMIRTWYLKELASHLTRRDKNGWKPFVPSYDHSFWNIFREQNVALSIFSRLATKVLFQFTKDEEHLSPHTVCSYTYSARALFAANDFTFPLAIIVCLCSCQPRESLFGRLDCSVRSTGDYYLIISLTRKTKREASFKLKSFR